MIVRNGICYPDIPERHVKIVAAENVGDHLLRVRFDDGDVRRPPRSPPGSWITKPSPGTTATSTSPPISC